MHAICIWCQRSNPVVTFNKIAHTIPKSLKGPIGKDICDDCNEYFGTRRSGNIPIDLSLKEVFNVSRAMFLERFNQVGKNKGLARKPSSVYFRINFEKRKIDINPSFKYRLSFQKEFAVQFRRGLYKIFLEESHRLLSNGHNQQYDFIRQFARYGLGNYPVYYFKRKHGIIMTTKELIISPELYFGEDQIETMKRYGFYEVEILGHRFSIPITSRFDIMVDLYRNHLNEKASKLYDSLIEINRIQDIDITLKILK